MPEEPRIRVTDKRGAPSEPRASAAAPDAPQHDAEETASAPEPEVRVVEVNKDYLDDLRRLQAEFDNYRKRMMKQQAEAAAAATTGLMKRMLPVLDHFNLAVEHGEGASGFELAFKELMELLVSEGLEEVRAEGQPFDPQLHEAVETHEDPDVDSEIVTKVLRRGYSYKGQLLRAPYVVVARPSEEGR